VGEGNASSAGAYACLVCGWVYDPTEGIPMDQIPPGIPFQDLPGDWVCPICGAEKERFRPFEKPQV
jgi:rubredoxin